MNAKDITKSTEKSSYSRLVTYLANPQNSQERVGHIRITHCVSHDHKGAILEVRNTQGGNRRVTDKTGHYLVSFSQGDEPTTATLQIIEQRLCQALGFEGHQRVSIVHHDTDNLHVHIAMNRIHPESLLGHSPSFSRWVMGYACEVLERELNKERGSTWVYEPRKDELKKAAAALRDYGKRVASPALCAAETWEELHAVAAHHGLAVIPRGNGLVFQHGNGIHIRASDFARELTSTQLIKRLGEFVPGTPLEVPPPRRHKSAGQSQTTAVGKTPAMEALGDTESLMGWIRRECGPVLGQAPDWESFHSIAAAYNLRVERRSNGLIFRSNPRVYVKASSVARAFSLRSLEARLGPFQPASQSVGSSSDHTTSYHGGPLAASSTLYGRYELDRKQQQHERDAKLDAIQAQAKLERALLDQRTRRLWHTLRHLRSAPFFRKLCQAQARSYADSERQRLREQVRTEKQRVMNEHRAVPWLDWLRAQAAAGDPEALAHLRKRSKAALHSANACTPANDSTRATHPYSDALRQKYDADKDAFYANRQAQLDELTRKHQQACKRHRESHQHRQAALRKIFKLGHVGESALASHTKYTQNAYRASLEQAYQAQQRAVLEQRMMPWGAWVQRQQASGDPDAQRASPTPFAVLAGVTSEGTVLYRVADAQARFYDNRLSLSSASNPVAAEAFLHLAVAHFGQRLGIDGDAQFRARMVDAAAQTNLEIEFLDPEMQARLQAQQKQNHDHGRTSKRRHRKPSTRTTGKRQRRTGGPNIERPAPGTPSREPRPARTRSPGTSHTLDGLPQLPSVPMVCNPSKPQVLLQSHVRGDLQRREPRGSNDTHRLRRSHGAAKVAPPKGRRRRR